MKKRIRIHGVVMFSCAAIVLLLPSVFLRKERDGVGIEFMEIFGIAFILLGQLFRVSSRGYKSDNSKNGSALIRGGPYALVRNPMYLGVFLIGLGVVLLLFKWWAILAFCLFFILNYVLLIYREEEKLLAAFPVEYPEYCRQVPQRIFPSLNKLLRADLGLYLPLKFPWIRRELSAILAVLFVAITVEIFGNGSGNSSSAQVRELCAILAVLLFFAGMGAYLIRRTRKNATAKS